MEKYIFLHFSVNSFGLYKYLVFLSIVQASDDDVKLHLDEAYKFAQELSDRKKELKAAMFDNKLASFSVVLLIIASSCSVCGILMMTATRSTTTTTTTMSYTIVFQVKGYKCITWTR